MINKLISTLDTKRFGFKIAKVDNWGANPQEIILGLYRENVKLIITRVAIEKINLINQLETFGFRVKDTQLTYLYKTKDLSFSSIDTQFNYIIREAEEIDINGLAEIAKNAFTNYGHYSANDRIDPEKANEIYADWTRRSYYDRGVADKFFVCVSERNELAGFLTFKLYKRDKQSYAASGLGCVSPHYRNQGVFHSLVKHGLLWGNDINLDWQEHNALSTNYPVGKVFTSIGFSSVSAHVTLHLWLDEIDLTYL